MRRPILGMLFALACVSIIVYPSTASAVPIHKHITVERVVGHDPDGPIRVPVHRVIKYDVAPPYVAPAPEPAASVPNESVAVPTPTTTSVPAASGGSCPASLAGESTSPTAVNPSSGASGCIQALPSTWAAYGDPAYASAADAPVSVQMEAMARICAAQGNDAWVAADPCG